MPWIAAAAAAIPSIVSGVGSLIGGNAEADAQQQAAQLAAQNARLGFNYLTGSSFPGYLAAGTTANDQMASLLGITPPSAPAPVYTPGQTYSPGVPPGPGGSTVDQAATIQNIRNVIAQYPTQGTGVWMQQQLAALQAANAPLSAYQTMLQGWASHTTSPDNAAAVSAIMSAANTPVMAKAAAPTPAPAAPITTPGTVTPMAGGTTTPAPATSGPSNNTAFNNYLNSTGYQFQLDQGTQAITSDMAAKGLLDSGGTLKKLAEFGQGLAGTYFNNYLGYLGDVANRGITAGATIGGAGSQAGAVGADALLKGNLFAADTTGNTFGNVTGAAAKLFNTPDFTNALGLTTPSVPYYVGVTPPQYL